MMTYLPLGRQGRFANGMFQIAGTIGIAVTSGQSYAFPKWINYDARDRFGSKEDAFIYKHFINDLPEVPTDIDFACYPYFWGYRYINIPVGNITFESHFQSPKYFANAMNLVQHYFTMKDELDYDATAIHFRFGDYSRDPNGYHPCPSVEYYREALKHLPPSELLVFSDDIDEAHKVMTALGVKYVMIEDDYLQSFKIMKRCRHFVTANSSYSMMAAILGHYHDKRIISPRNWFGPTVGLETADIYPEGTIII
jgi:hypothetical protein